MIGIEVFIVTFMSIFCFMSVMYDIRIYYKMGEYGIYRLSIGRRSFFIFKSINNQIASF